MFKFLYQITCSFYMATYLNVTLPIKFSFLSIAAQFKLMLNEINFMNSCCNIFADHCRASMYFIHCHISHLWVIMQFGRDTKVGDTWATGTTFLAPNRWDLFCPTRRELVVENCWFGKSWETICKYIWQKRLSSKLWRTIGVTCVATYWCRYYQVQIFQIC